MYIGGLALIKRTLIIVGVTVICLLLFTTPILAQTKVIFGNRVASKHNQWLLPVAGHVLCSDEQKHINRGSVRAWDLCMPFGSAIYPLADGVVIYAGCSNAGGYGCWVMLDYGNGYKSIMGHMINGSITVKSGDTVRQNQQIGKVGWTGMTSFGPHVHLEISQSDNRVMISDYFDRRLLHICNLCNVPKSKPVVANQSATYFASLQLNPIWLVVGLVLLIAYLLYSPKNSFLNGAYIGSGFALVTVSVAILPFIDLSVSQIGSSSGIASQADYQQIHAIVQKWEGDSCTVDPVLTFAGITQGTYSRYRIEQGLTYKHVCSISKQEIKDIYYRYYWLASGADKLPKKVAITYYDFAINAGVGAAKTALSRCGMDAHCFNNYRVTYYRGLKYCYLYCRGWLNRVEDIRRYSE